MTSKAAQKRARRTSRKIAAANQNKVGRPRREDVPRRNGNRIDYDSMETAAKARATVLDARQRIYGCNGNADRQEWGYSLGRLYLTGAFGKIDDPDQPLALRMLEAGNLMHQDLHRFYALSGISSPNPRAMDMTKVAGLSVADREDQARKAAKKMQGIMGALRLVDEQGRPVTVLVKRLVVEDEDTREWTPAMVTKAKRGLRSLVSFYGLDEGLTSTGDRLI